LLDTTAHIDYFVQTFDLQRDKFHRLFVGADESLFYPRDARKEDGMFRVFYYATYLPLHGIEYIIRAAKKLERFKEVEIEIIGKGPQYKPVLDLARSMEVHNVRFIEWVPYEDLPAKIAQADICLGGHFSDIEKARRVIPGKTFQYIAMQQPVIVGDCPGNREVFTHKENAFLVKMADADSLANAIVELKDNESLRKQVAEKGYKTFIEKCNIDAIGRTLKRILGEEEHLTV
jgi:glycosyltransferase involved in cell wall biosynthesis